MTSHPLQPFAGVIITNMFTLTTWESARCTKRGVQKIVMVKLMKIMEINDDNNVTD